ncbi:hypothetical protein ACW2Q0_00605 [Nocardia sp. R16R-3T]
MEATLPEIPRLAVLDLAAKKLFIDGAEFPWLISEEGPKLDDLASGNPLRSVTLTFFVEDVQVNPEHGGSGAEALARDNIEVSVMDCSHAPGGKLIVTTGGVKPQWVADATEPGKESE